MPERYAHVLRELEFRRDQVVRYHLTGDEWGDRRSDRLFRRVADLVHFVLTVPELRVPFLDRVGFVARAWSGRRARELRLDIVKALQRLAVELRDSPEWMEFSRDEHGRGLRLAAAEGEDVSDPDFVTSREVRLDRLAEGTAEFYRERGELESAERALDFLTHEAFGVMRTEQSESPLAGWADQWCVRANRTREQLAELRSLIDYVPGLHGARDAWILALYYSCLNPHVAFRNRPDGMLRMFGDTLGREARVMGRYFEHPVSEVVESCEILVHVLSQELLGRSSRNLAIDRFARFAEWFARGRLGELVTDAMQGGERAAEERALHEFIGESLFREGYVPLVELSLGRDRQESLGLRRLLSDHGGELTPDDVLLVEVKQAMVGELSDATFSDWVGQASEYATHVVSELHRADRVAYLLILYGGSMSYSAEPEIAAGGSAVRPVFVYLGDETAGRREPRPLTFASRPAQGE